MTHGDFRVADSHLGHQTRKLGLPKEKGSHLKSAVGSTVMDCNLPRLLLRSVASLASPAGDL